MLAMLFTFGALAQGVLLTSKAIIAVMALMFRDIIKLRPMALIMTITQHAAISTRLLGLRAIVPKITLSESYNYGKGKGD
jgi:hypothetical protein